MTSPVEKQSFGQAGAVFESGTTAITGDFCAIQVVEAATFSALTWAELSGDTITGVSFPAGFVIYGQITAFTLSAGKVLAYQQAK